MTYLAGETIVKQGDIGEDFFILKKGEAEVLHEEPDGTRKAVDYKYQGDWFGDDALTKGLPRNATIIAASTGQQRTEALRVDKTTFMQLLGPVRDILDRTENMCRSLDAFAVPLFAQLTAESRNELVKKLELEEFDDGSCVFKQGAWSHLAAPLPHVTLLSHSLYIAHTQASSVTSCTLSRRAKCRSSETSHRSRRTTLATICPHHRGCRAWSWQASGPLNHIRLPACRPEQRAVCKVLHVRSTICTAGSTLVNAPSSSKSPAWRVPRPSASSSATAWGRLTSRCWL
jgi:hypothetical protein